MKAVVDFILDLLPTLVAMTVCTFFYVLLQRFPIRTVAIWSASVNAFHLAATLILPSYFRRQPSGQYMRFVGVLIWSEFLMVAVVVIPVIYSLCSPKTVYRPQAYGLSIDLSQPPVVIPRRPVSEWIWAGVALVSFVGSLAIIFKLN